MFKNEDQDDHAEIKLHQTGALLYTGDPKSVRWIVLKATYPREARPAQDSELHIVYLDFVVADSK